MSHAFELRSIPDDRNRTRLFLLQLPLRTTHLPQVDTVVTIARLDGSAFQATAESLSRILVASGLSEQEVRELMTSGRTVPLAEDLAIRLGLIFNVVHALRSKDKIATALQRTETFSVDDSVFWFRKVVDGSPAAEVHRRALMMILTE